LKYYKRLYFKKFYHKIYHEKWILLFSSNEKGDFSFGQYRKLMPPKDRFWADPFVVFEHGEYYIFFEDISLKKNAKGTISMIQMDPKGNISHPITVLSKPYHLSYPFIFHWKGSYYMIPETSENGNIQLYKSSKFPFQWDYQYDLISNIVAADTTVVEHDGSWWLFTNVRENSGALNWDELYLFYSDDPTSNHWSAHPQNPIVSDTSSARPAGRLFKRNGQLYRPSQICQKRYGYGLKINKVITLSTSEYLEVEITSYKPGWSKNIIGLHTINEANNLTVVDGLMRIRKF
jgi:hypothetical protein